MGFLLFATIIGVIVLIVGIASGNSEVRNAGFIVAARGCLPLIGAVIFAIIMLAIMINSGAFK